MAKPRKPGKDVGVETGFRHSTLTALLRQAQDDARQDDARLVKVETGMMPRRYPPGSTQAGYRSSAGFTVTLNISAPLCT
jgi:hypothetical protein